MVPFWSTLRTNTRCLNTNAMTIQAVQDIDAKLL